MLAVAFLLILQASETAAPPAPTRLQPPPPDVSMPVLKSGTMETSDYPKSSLRHEEEGTVWVSFVVTAAGRARECRVAQSSGYPKLDEASCTIAESRYLLEPARDATGRAVEIRVQQAVVWKLL